ncbi:MAG: TetR/AcrR family transcriptional regulator [Xanthobacteraceae bacterium]
MKEKVHAQGKRPLFAKTDVNARSSVRLASLVNKSRASVSQEATVDRICDAALQLFVKKGYRATTIDEIARRVRLTKGAVYYYFHSKADLLDEIVERVRNEYPCGIPEGDGPREKLVKFLHTQAKWAIERPTNLLLMILMSVEFKDTKSDTKLKIDSIYADMSDAIARIVDEGKRLGIFSSPLSSRQIGAFYVAAHDGMMLEWYRGGRKLQKGVELVQALRMSMLNALAVRDAEGAQEK